MKNAIKYALGALVLSAVAVLGCSGAPEETHTVRIMSGNGSYERAAKPDEEWLFSFPKTDADFTLGGDNDTDATAPEGDYGQTSEALRVNALHGQQIGSDFGPCVFPNTSSTRCNIPTDKIIKYHWAGPETDSNFPNLNFRILMQTAISELNAQGTSFSFTVGASSSAEGMAMSNATNGSLALTVVPVGSDFVSGGNHYGKFNSCDTRVSLNALIAAGWSGLSQATQAAKIKRLMKHEIGHCAGFDDLNTGAGVRLMYAFDNPTPTGFSPDEVSALSFYQP